MAEDDHTQSHGNSAGIPPAPDSTTSSVAAAAIASLPPHPAVSAAPVEPSLPSVTPSTDSTSATADFDPHAAAPSIATSRSSAIAATGGAPPPPHLPPISTVAPSSAAPPASTTNTTTTATATAAPLHTHNAALQQNSDPRASEPESKQASDSNMSNHHPGAPHGLPVSYPGPSNPYPPTVGVSTAHYAPYPAVTTQAESYRPSPVPVASNIMSLPSMRTIDSIPQQPGPPPVAHPALSMSMPMAPIPAGVPYYGHQAMPMAPGYGIPADPMARYALPHDPRLLGHRGPKKEIKRRTKTGCLTCRKRRIKCDETHPTCNNCKKSKRECLGYDPIFRQQAGNQSGSSIQPASSSQPSTPSIPSSVPSTVPSSVAANPALTARATNSYGSQPSMLPSSYAPAHVSTSSPNPSVSPISYDHHPVKPESPYEYTAAAIDPALQTFHSSVPTPTSASDTSRLLDHKPLVDSSLHHLRANKMKKIDEIIDLMGPAPPARQIAHTEEMLNEITKVYHEMYAPGLSSFFETSWYYFVEDGKMSFPKDDRLFDLMANFLKVLELTKTNDETQMASSGLLETKVVWELARLTFQTPDTPVTSGAALPRDGDAQEARNRVRVIECLLCGDYLSTNPLSPPIQDPNPHRTRQFDFWYTLAEFLRTQDAPGSTAATQAREDSLSRMRHLLDGRENRDVLYSIAVVRQLAPNFEPGYGATLPQHFDETDPKSRLAVATKFILSEAQYSGGMTNVVRRFSDLACRAFVNPGVNITQWA